LPDRQRLVVEDEAGDRVTAAGVAHQADPRHVQLAAQERRHFGVGRGQDGSFARGFEVVEHRHDQQAPGVHALAEAVLAVHQFVLIERDDRVAPTGEVPRHVGVALVVALVDRADRQGARRRAGQVAFAVVAVDEEQQRRFVRVAFGQPHAAADEEFDPRVGAGRASAFGVRFLDGRFAEDGRVDFFRGVFPVSEGVRQFAVFRRPGWRATRRRGEHHRREEA
jgi:hypothetical protein